MLAALAAGLAAFLAAALMLLLGLLAIPVVLDFRIAWDKVLSDDVRLRWAFGLVRFRVRLKGARQERPQKPARKPRPRSRSWSRGRDLLRAARDEALRRRMRRLIGDLWRAVGKRDLRLRIRIGLGDPADTGRLWAAVGPIRGMLASLPADVDIEPDFVDSTLAVDASGGIRVVPLRLVFLGVALFASPPVWRGLRRMRGVR